MVGRPRPLEALNEIAASLSARLVLTATHDARDPVSRRRILSNSRGSRLSRIAVVKPDTDAPDRWTSLSRGRILAAYKLRDGEDLDDAADAILDIITPLTRT